MSALERRCQAFNKAWTYGHATKRRFGSLVTAANSRVRLIERTQGLEGKLVIYRCMWGDEFDEAGPSGTSHYHVAHENPKFANSVFDSRVPEELIAEALKRSRRQKGKRTWE